MKKFDHNNVIKLSYSLVIKIKNDIKNNENDQVDSVYNNFNNAFRSRKNL